MPAEAFATVKSSSNDLPSSPLRIGIVGCGIVSQTTHFPIFKLMSDHFTILHICDISPSALAHCAAKYGVPRTTTSYHDLIADEDVEAVFVLTTDEWHRDIAALALEKGKCVFIEKCVTVNRRECEDLIEMEKSSKWKVMVGYMRRFAAGFGDLLEEIRGLEVRYARVRDIIGERTVLDVGAVC
jgi:predicted dehydrogenase